MQMTAKRNSVFVGLGLAAVAVVSYVGYQATHVHAQQAATMQLQTDGPQYPAATFTLPNGSKPVTNPGPSGTLTLGGSLISLGTQTVTVSWAGATPGQVYLCGTGSATATAQTLAALTVKGVVVTAGQVNLVLTNESPGLLSATNVINIACTQSLN